MPRAILQTMSAERMAATDPEAKIVETRSGAIAVSFEGPEKALPVLCVHGIPGSRRDFRYLAPLLAERVRVLRVEMPGFGESPADGRGTVSGWADVLLAVADALELRRFALLSHSFGGGAVLLASARAGERLAGAVLLATMGARRHRAFALPPAVYSVMSALLRFPLTRAGFAALGRQFYRRIRLTPPDDWRELHLHTTLLASVDFAALGAARGGSQRRPWSRTAATTAWCSPRSPASSPRCSRAAACWSSPPAATTCRRPAPPSSPPRFLRCWEKNSPASAGR